MRTALVLSIAGLLSAGSAVFAQGGRAPWEIGVGAGFGFHRQKDVTARDTTAKAGIAPGLAVTGFLGQDMYRYLSGEIRYTFQYHDLQLKSAGTEVKFDALSHAVHYDFLIHSAPRGAKVRPFAAVGGGAKQYRGTGKPVAVQPLSSFAFLTDTSEWKGLASVGGGVKVMIGERVNFRVEARDYITPFPKEVIAPARGAAIRGWVHNIWLSAGISYSF